MGNDLDSTYPDFANYKMEKAREFYEKLKTNCRYRSATFFNVGMERQKRAAGLIVLGVLGVANLGKNWIKSE